MAQRRYGRLDNTRGNSRITFIYIIRKLDTVLNYDKFCFAFKGLIGTYEFTRWKSGNPLAISSCKYIVLKGNKWKTCLCREETLTLMKSIVARPQTNFPDFKALWECLHTMVKLKLNGHILHRRNNNNDNILAMVYCGGY